MRDYRHQCRYCSWCVDTGASVWCEEREKEFAPSRMRRPNKCKSFVFNPMPADDPFGREYKPRKRAPFVQDKLFEIPTDRQRENK